jgi:hypothetical protein
MDAATLSALRVTPPKSNPPPEPAVEAGTWRRLRNGDMQFLQKLNAGDIPPPKPQSASPEGSAVASSVGLKSSNPAVMDPHTPPPTLPEDVAQPTATPVGQPRAGSNSPPESADDGKEWLRDYVGAFILAGLDPQVEAELDFFARRVNYFGEANISREKIRADLVRYDERWPQRRFWLAGADPTLELYDGNGVLLASNDDWRDTQEADITATGLAPSNDAESAILRTLAPSLYTAIVGGANETTGVALVEVYNLGSGTLATSQAERE